MRKKEKNELRNASIEELNKKLISLRSELARQKVERYTKQSKNVRSVREKRRSIAVIQSYIHEKELQNHE